MTKALIALHFQNDICHPDGVIPFAVDRASADARCFLDASRRTIARARGADWLIAHVHIAFQPDYSDVPRNCRLFRSVETLGALERGSWGAQPMEGFEPASKLLEPRRLREGVGSRFLVVAQHEQQLAIADATLSNHERSARPCEDGCVVVHGRMSRIHASAPFRGWFSSEFAWLANEWSAAGSQCLHAPFDGCGRLLQDDVDFPHRSYSRHGHHTHRPRVSRTLAPAATSALQAKYGPSERQQEESPIC